MVVVLRTRFDQQHPAVHVGAQPVCHQRAGGAGADNDVVEGWFAHWVVRREYLRESPIINRLPGAVAIDTPFPLSKIHDFKDKFLSRFCVQLRTHMGLRNP